jgi:hypothetical protein
MFPTFGEEETKANNHHSRTRHEGPELYVTLAVSVIFQLPLPADKKPALYTRQREMFPTFWKKETKAMLTASEKISELYVVYVCTLPYQLTETWKGGGDAGFDRTNCVCVCSSVAVGILHSVYTTQ